MTDFTKSALAGLLFVGVVGLLIAGPFYLAAKDAKERAVAGVSVKSNVKAKANQDDMSISPRLTGVPRIGPQPVPTATIEW